ncbi:hypothetical protein AURDEDRAFT_150132 [Auricularia subglabra TFB-10046 SS5]|nr:hypothetical protein AURDEDRAFT_150132 [Auricularia subglabra TFB-10046 SS5]
MYARELGGCLEPAFGLPDSAADCEQYEAKQRASALDPDANVIVRPNLPPRRVWDLYSNRVVPNYMAIKLDAAISHSWMAPQRRQLVRTAINGYEWPVPIPNDTTLERVRVELLNLRMHYVWLDVLCLRQVGALGPDGLPENEAIRHEEWKIDVPTIGAVYHGTTMVVHYYSGLGRPFKVGNLDDERHWINRAWTLQEVSTSHLIAGKARYSPDPGDGTSDPQEQRLYNVVSSLLVHAQRPASIFPMLKAMRFRAATSEQDKISGLAYRLGSGSSRLPPYIIKQDAEPAWDALVRTMHARFRGDLLFRFPLPGDGKYKWYPSWHQIIDRSTVLPPADDESSDLVDISLDSGAYCYRGGYRFGGCRMTGLPGAPPNSHQQVVVIPGPRSKEHQLLARVAGNRPVADGTYTLVANQSLQWWVVGVERGGPWEALRAIEKVAVLFVTENEAYTFRKDWERYHTCFPLAGQAASRFL